MHKFAMPARTTSARLPLSSSKPVRDRAVPFAFHKLRATRKPGIQIEAACAWVVADNPAVICTEGASGFEATVASAARGRATPSESVFLLLRYVLVWLECQTERHRFLCWPEMPGQRSAGCRGRQGT
jgi:hypothetical protein